MVLLMHYPNAPITEAIIDIRAELPEEMTVALLGKMHSVEESAYPSKKSRHLAMVEGQIGGATASAFATSKQVGILCLSKDERQVFQARLDGFTMSRLAPYERWEPFRDEAKRLWHVYQSIAKPTCVTRIAVRYINRIDLPLPISELKDYLRTVPEVSTELPQQLSGYFMQIRIPQDDIVATLLLNEAIIEPVRPGVASVILDIDVFRSDALPTDDDRVWEILEGLRMRKNEVFEASITNKARELFR